jgi:hypothetical protein
MKLERFFGVKDQPGQYLLNLRVGKFELDVPFSEKRSPTLNTPFVLYHYTPVVPYTATISGTSTSSFANPNSFMIGPQSAERIVARGVRGIGLLSQSDLWHAGMVLGLSLRCHSKRSAG